jgi:hypothetical protein
MLHRTDASRQTVDMGSKADIAASPTDVCLTSESRYSNYAPQGRKLNFKTARILRVPSQIF